MKKKTVKTEAPDNIGLYYDCRSLRGSREQIRDQIKLNRRLYLHAMLVRFKFLPPSQRTRFVAEMPEKMRALGMYAASTYGGDILWSIVKLWYICEGGKFRYEERGAWLRWLTNWDLDRESLMHEYAKVRIELRRASTL